MISSTTFSYLDQFNDIDIDLTSYLKAIKDSTGFDYTFTNTQPIHTTIKNLFDKIEIVNTYKKNITFFSSYTILDNEDIFILSNKFYGNTESWWLICLFNNIQNVFNDWPLSEIQLQKISQHLFDTENKYNLKTYYELLSNRNELKRKILVLRPEYINDVVVSFVSTYKQI